MSICFAAASAVRKIDSGLSRRLAKSFTRRGAHLLKSHQRINPDVLIKVATRILDDPDGDHWECQEIPLERCFNSSVFKDDEEKNV